MRTLGTHGPLVSDIGLGCMGMSDLYGPADEQESLATIRAALDTGVTLLDTGDDYGMGHNELLIRDALKGRNRDGVVVSVKDGALRDPKGNWLGTDWVDIHRPKVVVDVPVRETRAAAPEISGSRRTVPGPVSADETRPRTPYAVMPMPSSIERAVSVDAAAGDRYAAAQMAMLDSEGGSPASIG